jgi:3-oxoacyl-[acyl-carrier protein] reductase
VALTVPTYPDLAGRVALVTGGSRGIGAAACRLLAANGVKVAVGGRDPAAIATVVEDIRSRAGQATGVTADCTDPAAVKGMREHAERELGPVDILAAFAGGGGEPVPVEQITEEEWRRSLDANLTTTFLTVRAFLPGMVERRKGSIVTMGSTAGRLPGGSSASYAAAKAAVLMFSRHVAREVGEHGVRVNCIAPSAILTEGLAARLPEQRRQEVASHFPLGRLGLPEDVALVTLFLASDASSWLTGLTIDVTGGRIII